MRPIDIIREIGQIDNLRSLRRIQKALGAQLFEVRFADDPKEKARILRARRLMKGAKIRL